MKVNSSLGMMISLMLLSCSIASFSRGSILDAGWLLGRDSFSDASCSLAYSPGKYSLIHQASTRLGCFFGFADSFCFVECFISSTSWFTSGLYMPSWLSILGWVVSLLGVSPMVGNSHSFMLSNWFWCVDDWLELCLDLIIIWAVFVWPWVLVVRPLCVCCIVLSVFIRGDLLLIYVMQWW